jgi:hypothetical protein
LIVTYSPAGQDPQTWEWDPNQVRAKDAEAVEDKFEGTWDEFNVQLLHGRMRARRVLLWHLQRADHPTIKLEDIDFAAAELTLQMEPAELQKMRAGIEKAAGVSDAKRRTALALIDQEIAEAGGTPGKATSPVSGNATP